MAGIYIHIPFCKQACSYCDFHFSTNLARKQELLQSLLKEIQLRKEYLEGEEVETIYFGGGTPSLLSAEEVNTIVDSLINSFNVKEDVELTLEANPDDLTQEKLKELRETAINRLSIGVQSFFEEDLRFMNRAHTSKQAKKSLSNALDSGFENINVDLIFGSQTTTNQMWEENLNLFFSLEIPHLSAYSLTIEEKTALAHNIDIGKVSSIDEEKNFKQYTILQTLIKENGFEQYELSNYCKENNISAHNKSYWFGEKYIGIGPSAHSFDGNSRQWNISNNALYIKKIRKGEQFFSKENLSIQDKYHEYLITSLRTKWGIDKGVINDFGNIIREHFNSSLLGIASKKLILEEHRIKVNPDYLFQSDEIVRDLMIE